MTEAKKKPVIPILVFLVMFGLGSWFALRNNGTDDVNPYPYDISAYKSVPEGLLKWREEPPIVLPADRIPQSMTVGSVGQLAIGFNKGLQVYHEDGKVEDISILSEPVYCLAFDEEGRLYCGVTRGVVILDPSYKLIQRIDLGENARLTSIACYEDNVFVCDFGQRRVWRLDANGTPDLHYAGPKGVFSLPSPYFDTVASDAGLWIVDPGRHEIRLHTGDFTVSRTIGKTGMGPAGFSGCCNPTHIAVQKDGSIVTLEKGLPRVRIFNADGTLREFVTAADSLTETVPASDLAVLPDGRIAVLDPFKKHVKLFKRL